MLLIPEYFGEGHKGRKGQIRLSSVSVSLSCIPFIGKKSGKSASMRDTKKVMAQALFSLRFESFGRKPRLAF